MSIDFSKIKSIDIPEGKAKSVKIKLADGSDYEVGFGPAMCTVTVTHDAYDAQYFLTSCSATLPDGSYVSLDSAGTYELPIGTVITCRGLIYYSQSSIATMKVYLNEEEVAKAYGENNKQCSYEYTLSKNITIDPRTDKAFTYDDPNKFGAIYITEREGDSVYYQ